MKKMICCLLAGWMLLSMAGMAIAEETNESVFESFLLKKGVLISKEFIDVGTLKTKSSSGFDYPITIQVATLTDAQTGERYQCLRLSFETWNGRDIVETAVTLDADEVDSAVAAFEYMQNQLDQKTLKNYTELVFATNSEAIFTLTYSGSNDVDFVIQNSDGIQFFSISAISEIAKGLTAARTKLAQ